MPVHDWTKVEAGIFHNFHHCWITENIRVLNDDLLPDGFYALAEQITSNFVPDVLTLQAGPRSGNSGLGNHSTQVQLLSKHKPATRFHSLSDATKYLDKV